MPVRVRGRGLGSILGGLADHVFGLGRRRRGRRRMGGGPLGSLLGIASTLGLGRRRRPRGRRTRKAVMPVGASMGGRRRTRRGRGFWDALSGVHNWVKDKKLLSKGADLLGYGRRRRRRRLGGRRRAIAC